MMLNLYVYRIQKNGKQKKQPEGGFTRVEGSRIPQDIRILNAAEHFAGDLRRESQTEIHADSPESHFPTMHSWKNLSDAQKHPAAILKTDKGRPFLRINGCTRETDPSIPDISVTDSGMYRIIGVADRRIGIDLQQNVLHSTTDSEEDARRCRKLASRFFHPCECAYVLAAETEIQIIRRFFRIWTAKEAYVKYTGSGIDGSFSTFSVIEPAEAHTAAADPYISICNQNALYLRSPGLSCSFIYPKPDMHINYYTLCICTDVMEPAGLQTMSVQQECNTGLQNFTLLRIRNSSGRHADERTKV
ncbi:MAG: 4'-phosphopantetheinyl transferase family protein [Bilifractor sp.]